jgi:hypothetical protein
MLKYLLVSSLLFLLILASTTAQESTNISIKSFDNEELSDLSDFMGVVYRNISCSDTNMRGKVFVLYLEEYTKGKVTSLDTILEPGVKIFDITPEGESKPHFYVLDGNDKLMYKNGDSTFNLKVFGRKDGEDHYYFLFSYSGMSGSKYIEAKSEYKFFQTTNCGNDGMEVQLDAPTPILAYAPGATEGTMNSFCSLRAINASEWYEKFKLEHFWVVSLDIIDPVGPTADELIEQKKEEIKKKK